jgi:hypothetical protein
MAKVKYTYRLHNERVGMEKIRRKKNWSKNVSRRENFAEGVRC